MKIKRAIILGALLSFVLTACDKNNLKDHIRISGTVEIDTVKIASLIGGRVLEVNMEEGEMVEKDQIVARLDCKELELQLKNAQASLKAANANFQLIKKGARREDILHVRELLKQAEVARQNAEEKYKRAEALYKENLIPKDQFDDASAHRDVAIANEAAIRQQYEKILAGARAEEIEAALAMVEQAETAIALLKEKMSYCEVKSPISGTILYKLVEPKEVVTAGATLGVVADLTKAKVKGYIAEKDLGFVKIGGRAKVFIDSQPDIPIEAKVTYIASEAEFTPKNIQTEKERVKTMYEIKVSVDNSDGKLKSGMPAEIVIER